MTSVQPRIAVYYRMLPHYRVRLYRLVADMLTRRGVAFQLLIGQVAADAAHASRRDEGWLPEAVSLPTRTLRIAGRKLHLHDLRGTGRPAVVVCEQSVQSLANLWYLLLHLLGRTRLIWWGHGRNLQGDSPWLAERLKRALTRRPALWFSYNAFTDRILRENGVPAQRIWALGNTIDTTAFADEVRRLRAAGRPACEQELGLPHAPFRIVYCGALNAYKGVGLLLEAFAAVRQAIPDSHLVVIGDGPERPELEERAPPGVHFAGFREGRWKAVAFAAADVCVCPGAVGLNILDAFAAGLPFVTVAVPTHGPEFAYLRPGLDGLVAEAAPGPLSTALLSLADPARAAAMSAAASATAQELTIERMAARFAAGVLMTLRHPRHGAGVRRCSSSQAAAAGGSVSRGASQTAMTSTT